MGNDSFITPQDKIPWSDMIEIYKSQSFEPWTDRNKDDTYAFVMAPKAILYNDKIPSTVVRVYEILLDRQMASVNNPSDTYRDKDGYYVIFRRKELADIMNVEEHTITRALKVLKDNGLISVKKTPAGLPQKIYVYRPRH